MTQWANALTSEPKPEDLPYYCYFILVLGCLMSSLNFC